LKHNAFATDLLWVKGFHCEVLERRLRPVEVVKREAGLGSESEQLADKKRLADRISFSQPSHSILPNHVHCLDSLQRPPRTLKGSIILASAILLYSATSAPCGH